MSGKPLSYYLGPHLSGGLLNAYRPIEALLGAVRRDPTQAGLLAAETVGPQADIKGMVDSYGSAVQNFRQGNIGAGLLDAAYVPANAMTLALPGSASGMRRGADGVFDALRRSGDDLVDQTMPARLVNPEMRVFQGGPNKYGPDVPGTRPGLDSSKIGTGEGAQVYGHGHYLAENPSVAREYKNSVLGIGGGVPQWDDPAFNAVRLLDDAGGDYDKAIQAAGKLTDKGGWRDDVVRVLEDYKRQGIMPSGGHLYEYDLPDETIAKMLDWDKPLSEQPEAVKKIAEPMVSAMRAKFPNYNPTGETLVKQVEGGRLGDVGRDKAARTLREAGIPGIRYLDQGSRGTGGTSNFVVFDDDAAKLLARDDVRFDDLPMDEASRMARAREMGLDTDVYHATKNDVSEFDMSRVGTSDFGSVGQGVYTTPKTGLANAYSQLVPEGNAGANIMPLKARIKNPYFFDSAMLPRNAEESALLTEKVKAMGHDAIVTRLPNGEWNEVVVLDPKNIRSRFAKFDPAKKDSANILAGIGGAGLLAAGVADQYRQDQGLLY